MVARTRPLIIRARVACARSRHGKRRGRLECDAGGGRGEAGREGVSLIWYEGGCSGSRFFDGVDGPGKTKRTVKDRRKLAMAGDKTRGSPGGNGTGNGTDPTGGGGREGAKRRERKEKAREGEKRREEREENRRRKRRRKKRENRRRETEERQKRQRDKRDIESNRPIISPNRMKPS